MSLYTKDIDTLSLSLRVTFYNIFINSRDMKEQLLHFVWQHRRFDQYELLTQCGEKISIIHPGFNNHHDGPDFLNAKIRIGSTIWNGHVEIHVDGIDWYRHRHHYDPNYANVILHVVYRNGQLTNNIGGHEIPTLELGGLIPLTVIDKYEQLIVNSSVIACSNHLQDIDEFIIRAWKERLIAERFEEKVIDFEQLIDSTKGNWEAAFFQLLTRHFGVHSNMEGFQVLSESLDYRILLKHHEDLFQLEAILFGQAGMLDRNFNDIYPNELKKEYQYLSKKYKLKSIYGGNWKFKGLRPVSFPTIRIAQLAALIHRHAPLFATFQDSDSPETILRNIIPSDYWMSHYTFDTESRAINKVVGKTFANLIIINVYIPMLFSYGKAMSIPDLSLYAIELLATIRPEVNRKTKLWKSLGVSCDDAGDSQALIQAINHYCIERKCLDCPIGCHILKGEDHFPPPEKLEEPTYIYN
ncbi:MAG: DUF2851 family protein [Bacteroidetes bacterium]|nr:DUF2851 family protein [Bacteroidota bacterium]